MTQEASHEAVDATPEAVRARIRRLETDYAADGAAFDAKLLAALLARAERAERERDEARCFLAEAALSEWDLKQTCADLDTSIGYLTADRDEARRLLRAALPTFERELAEADSAGEKMFPAQMIQAIKREIGEVA